MNAGYRVIGYDLDTSRPPSLGIEAGESLADVGQRVERVVLCLPDSDVVNSVVLGEDGLLSTSEVRHIVDTTTGTPERGVALAERLREHGVGTFFTVDAGPQVKAICLAADVARVNDALQSVPGVVSVITSGLGPGARLTRPA